MKSKALVILVLIMFTINVIGCGYIMHPERRTAPKSNQVDGGVILLDCLWLFAGIIPGVIALAVDGVSETWYYSQQEMQEMEKEVSVNAGQEIMLQVAGAAPTDAEVYLSLMSTEDDILQQTVQTIKAGETLGALSLNIPDNIQNEQAKLALVVNGEVQFTWNLHLHCEQQVNLAYRDLRLETPDRKVRYYI